MRRSVATDEGVREGAYALDLDLDPLTAGDRPDARRSPGQDDIARQQGEGLRDVGDQDCHAVDHVGCPAVLHHLTIAAGDDGEVAGVEVGLDPRPQRAERVEAFGPGPLTIAALKIT